MSNLSMKKLTMTLMSLWVIGAAGPLFAGGSATANISKVGLIQSIGDVLFVQLSPATVSGAPGCAVNTEWQFVVSLTTTQGQQMLALLLDAKATNASVQLAGTGTCNVYGNVETLDAIYF